MTLIFALVIVSLVATLASSTLAALLNNTHYVTYSEKSSVDYGVHLKDNDFYDESFLGKDYAYIATLIDTVEASFDYSVIMQSEGDVSFDYTYRIDSVVEIKHKHSGKVLYAPVYNEIAEVAGSEVGKGIGLERTVFVDYDKYNAVAKSFIDTYELENLADACLVLQMIVDVKQTSDAFHSNENKDSYVSSLSIPLSMDTVEIKITSEIPAEEQKILSYTTENISDTFRNVAICFAVATALLALLLWLYAYLSRNIDITYDIKVAKLMRNYKSFIQRIRNSFDTEGYQVLLINSFGEMLEIRDTIQSPILMEENGDRTCSKFFIPTATKILYLFEIKVDDYDRIYNKNDSDNSPCADGYGVSDADCDESVTIVPVRETQEAEPEAVTVTADVTADSCEPTLPEEEAAPIIDVIEENAPQLPDGVEIIEESSDNEDGPESIVYIDDTGKRINIACNRSFMANLIQSNETVKGYYSAIKNHILSYKKVKARLSWRYESYNRGRLPLFKMKIRGKTICLYCALNPDEFEKSRYFHERATAKNFAAVPMLVRLRSDRGLKKALGLIDTVMQRFEIPEAAKKSEVDYPKDYPYESTKQLVERGLIKLLFPGAQAAEPKPHHHVHKKIAHDNVVEELTIFDGDEVTPEEIEEVIEEIIEEPTLSLEEIDYDDASESSEGFVETEENHGVDVIGVVWPERPKRNKIYRYDPDGETVEVGDVVIVPTRDVSKGRDVVRKAVVAHKNHKVAPEAITQPLKKVIGVLRKIK